MGRRGKAFTFVLLAAVGFVSFRELTNSSNVMRAQQLQEIAQQKATITPAAPVPGCVPPPSGLVGWWPFDGNAHDFYETSNAVVRGGAGFVPAMVSQALQFDGLGGYAGLDYSPSLDVGLGDEFTIDLWINPSDLSVQRPLVEWNNGAGLFGVHLWQSVTFGGAQGPGNLYANIQDTNGVGHIISSAPGVLQQGVYQRRRDS